MSDTESHNDEDVRSPMYAALAVAFIAVVFGIPVWWLSTTTYRASLPYQEIQELPTKQTNCLIPVTVISCLTQEEKQDFDNFQAELNALLQSDQMSLLSVQYSIDWKSCSFKDQEVLGTSSSLAELDRRLSTSSDIPHGQVTIYLVSQGYSLLNSTDSFVGTGRVAVATPKDSVVASLIRTRFANEDAMTRVHLNAAGARRLDKADAHSMRSLLSTPGYELSFSLLNPQPATFNAQWNIQEAVQAYLNPFLQKLSEFAEFTVNSQVLYFTGLSIKPKHNEEDDSYRLSQNALPLVINPVEAKLGSHVSTNPSLNFLLFVPRSRHLPLFITDNKGQPVDTNAFLSPRWGGVMIHNVPKPSENDSLPLAVKIDTRRAMEVFLAQLRLLIGIPQQAIQDNVILAAPDKTGITDWEYDVLLRVRTLENLATASSTLVSLAQLLNQIGNIVIRDDIANQVYQAVSAIKQGHTYLQRGNLYRAFHDSKRAIAASEKAFFDPSLLELLYFPDDQKFAIYIPLFLPVGIPVLSSFVKALRWMKTKMKPKQD